MAFYLSGLGRINVPTPPIPIEVVPWSTGTDAEIVSLIQSADDRDIDLSEYWNIGDERTISLSAIATSGSNTYGSWSVGESQPAHDQVFTLMDFGHYSLTTATSGGKTINNCVVGMKNAIKNAGYMNSNNTNIGSWNGSNRRAWCNAGLRASIPSTLLPAFKQFNVITAETYNGSTNQTSADYFALFAEKEVFGSQSYSNITEANALTQIQYYITAANRIKARPGYAAGAWNLRSPDSTNSQYFGVVTSQGTAYSYKASQTYIQSPFGCI